MTWLFFFLRKRSNNLTPVLQTDDPIYHGPLTRLLKQRCFFHMHVLRVVVQTKYVITILHI